MIEDETSFLFRKRQLLHRRTTPRPIAWDGRSDPSLSHPFRTRTRSGSNPGRLRFGLPFRPRSCRIRSGRMGMDRWRMRTRAHRFREANRTERPFSGKGFLSDRKRRSLFEGNGDRIHLILQPKPDPNDPSSPKGSRAPEKKYPTLDPPPEYLHRMKRTHSSTL